VYMAQHDEIHVCWA
jgi:hypothetical protein